MKPQIYLAISLTFLISACSLKLSEHPVAKAPIGKPSNEEAIIDSLSKPGILTFEKVHTFTMHSTRGEQFAISDDTADDPELVEGYFYAISHPEKGVYLIDAGIPDTYFEHLNLLAKNLLPVDDIQIHITTNEWLKSRPPLAGVFLTHLHFDHMLGVEATPINTPLYVGPNDGTQEDLLSLFGSPTDSALEGRPPLLELQFPEPKAGNQHSILDIFGDGSLWAIHTPSHSPGSLAFLAHTTNGPQLIAGDAVRLNSEWKNGLMPAYAYEEEYPAVKRDREFLIRLSKADPRMKVHLGHQELRAD